jgi:hypothetical protein
MSGYAGIHAMQADWESSRIVAFFSSDALGEPIDGGQLSPDGKWYASPIGDTFVGTSLNQYWTTNGLRLYSTVDDTELTFDIREYDNLLDYNRLDFYGTASTYEAVRWVDDNSLIIGSFLIRPFERKVDVASIEIAEAFFADFEAAPDWSRVYGFISSGQRGEGIFDPKSPDEAITYLPTEAVAWKHDSTGFVAEQLVDVEEQLSLYNRDGEFIERVYASEGGRVDIRRTVAGRNELGWSPDNHYFAFVNHPPYPQDPQLILLDMENHIAVNTCLSPVSLPVWSPDGKQIAMLLLARDNLKVIILDLDTWTAYDVARHSGIRGALSPDMIAWRSND